MQRYISNTEFLNSELNEKDHTTKYNRYNSLRILQ